MKLTWLKEKDWQGQQRSIEVHLQALQFFDILLSDGDDYEGGDDCQSSSSSMNEQIGNGKEP